MWLSMTLFNVVVSMWFYECASLLRRLRNSSMNSTQGHAEDTYLVTLWCKRSYSLVNSPPPPFFAIESSQSWNVMRVRSMIEKSLLHLLCCTWLSPLVPLRNGVSTLYPHSAGGHVYIIVVVDYFTKWAKVMPTFNKTGETTAYFFFNHVIARFGVL